MATKPTLGDTVREICFSLALVWATAIPAGLIIGGSIERAAVQLSMQQVMAVDRMWALQEAAVMRALPPAPQKAGQ